MTVSRLLGQVAAWAADREDILAVGLAGSWARGAATPESDVDLVTRYVTRPTAFIAATESGTPPYP